jgi:serine/threonine protein kinase
MPPSPRCGNTYDERTCAFKFIDQKAPEGCLPIGAKCLITISVYRGTLNGRPVAVKVPNPSTTRNTANFSDVYRSELELLLRIRHDHVVPLVAYCTARSALIFPRLTPLTDILSRVDIASVLHDALRGIAYIHESGHVHRDVKLAG